MSPGTRHNSPWQEIHELGEQGLAGVHEHLLGKTPKSATSNSNQHHAFSLQTPQLKYVRTGALKLTALSALKVSAAWTPSCTLFPIRQVHNACQYVAAK